MNKVEEMRDWFSKQVETEVHEWDIIPPEERPTSIVLVAFFSLLLLYFVTDISETDGLQRLGRQLK